MSQGLINPAIVSRLLADAPHSAPVTHWLLRILPAAGFALQQPYPAYGQVSMFYAPLSGYFPLSGLAGFCVLAAWTAAAGLSEDSPDIPRAEEWKPGMEQTGRGAVVQRTDREFGKPRSFEEALEPRP